MSEQRQDSLSDQLRHVAGLATAAGCYDAADWLKAQIESPEPGDGNVSPSEFMQSEAGSIDATEEVAEGDGREWMIGEEPDGSPRIEGLRLGDAVESVVPKSVLTAERERREELEEALKVAMYRCAELHRAGFDSTRKEIAERAVREIESALASLPDRGTPNAH